MSTGPDEEHCLMVVSCNSNENGMFLSSQLKFFEKYLRKVNKIFKKVLLKMVLKLWLLELTPLKFAVYPTRYMLKKSIFSSF